VVVCAVVASNPFFRQKWTAVDARSGDIAQMEDFRGFEDSAIRTRWFSRFQLDLPHVADVWRGRGVWDCSPWRWGGGHTRLGFDQFRLSRLVALTPRMGCQWDGNAAGMPSNSSIDKTWFVRRDLDSKDFQAYGSARLKITARKKRVRGSHWYFNCPTATDFGEVSPCALHYR